MAREDATMNECVILTFLQRAIEKLSKSVVWQCNVIVVGVTDLMWADCLL